MDEQRRVYLAIVLSVVVLMGWNILMGPQVAPVIPASETPADIDTPPSLPSEPSLVESQPGEDGQVVPLGENAAVIEPAKVEVVQQEHKVFHTLPCS